MSRRRTCIRCGVAASWLPSREPSNGGLPTGWADDDGDGLRCLRCRREVAVEHAEAEAERNGESPDGVGIRRQALIAFELTRDPSRTNAAIAHSLRPVTVGASAVAKARERNGGRS